MSESRYHVSGISLRLRHPSADVGMLMKEWGLKVDRSWKTGEPRATPKGRPLEGVWSESYAYTRLPFQDGLRLSVALRHVLDGLAGQASAIADFVDRGGYAELFIGWHFDDNSGDELQWKLLDRLAKMKLALGFDIYPWSDLGGED